MFSTKPTQASTDLYFVCVGSTNTSNTDKKPKMAYQGKISFSGYVSEK